MAGLYNDNGAIIITIQSSSKLNYIHHRQPLIIKDNHLDTWIQNRKIVPINSENIHFHKISNNINNSKNIIELKNISLSFGGVKALTEVSFESSKLS